MLLRRVIRLGPHCVCYYQAMESLFGKPGVALSYLTWVWICLLGSGEKQSWEEPAPWGPNPLIQSLTVLWLANGLRQASSCSFGPSYCLLPPGFGHSSFVPPLPEVAHQDPAYPISEPERLSR